MPQTRSWSPSGLIPSSLNFFLPVSLFPVKGSNAFNNHPPLLFLDVIWCHSGFPPLESPHGSIAQTAQQPETIKQGKIKIRKNELCLEMWTAFPVNQQIKGCFRLGKAENGVDGETTGEKISHKELIFLLLTPWWLFLQKRIFFFRRIEWETGVRQNITDGASPSPEAWGEKGDAPWRQK